MPISNGGLLQDARVYLSGPMDFVASRDDEKRLGWRTRVGQFLRQMGGVVFDPWDKPDVRGLHEYGIEGEKTTSARDGWTFAQTTEGAIARSQIADGFWPALHIDLRMVDTSDFVICYCPTNIYSVGTPHEIILARQQRKPVLFVSPHVAFPALHELEAHLDSQGDEHGKKLLTALTKQVPIKANPNASPSLWYMPLIGEAHFFDGFGFEMYRQQFPWQESTSLDTNEAHHPPAHPLLPFLEAANREIPKKWNRHRNQYVVNDDWLLWDLKKDDSAGGRVKDVKEPAAYGRPITDRTAEGPAGNA
jgi:hypothetical protein